MRHSERQRAARLRLLLTGSLLAGVMTAAVVLAGPSPAEAAGSCTFNDQTSLVPSVAPGGTISVVCTGIAKKTAVFLVEESPLAGLVSSSNQEAEADTSSLQQAESTSSGTLDATFDVPSPFTASDPNAQCPPTQAQVNAGEEGCSLSAATVSGTSYGTVTLDYSGQPTAQPPALSLSPTSASPGQQVTISDGAGPGHWWGNAGAVTTLTSADVSLGGVPVPGAAGSISQATYNYNPPAPLTAPALSGSFVVPCSTSATPTVTVTEPNTTGFPGTVSASAPLSVIGGGTEPDLVAMNPTEGPKSGRTTVTITGCNFTGVTSVKFGKKRARHFTVDSDTQITAVTPPHAAGLVVVHLKAHSAVSPVSAADQYRYN